MPAELPIYLCCIVVASLALAWLGRHRGWQAWALALALLQGGLMLLILAPDTGEQPVPGVTVTRTDREYAGSGACRSCHPSQYASWHESYHRSMTERASVESMRAPWRGRLEWRGRSYELYTKGDEFWARLPDPNLTSPDAPSVERRIVMTTGSHHYQAYWVEGERGNELWQFSFVYHFESQRFIPRHDAFLQPPDAPVHHARWNSNCVQCHALAGKPKHDEAADRFATEAEELGISCEACHGPARQHVDLFENPVARYRQHQDPNRSAHVVQPAKLEPEAASQVCGQCHSYFVPTHPDQWWDSGFSESFRAGAELASSRLVLDYSRDRKRKDPIISASIDSIFFKDGTIRVGGREYNGLVKSPCYQRGSGKHKLSCLSCHELHGSSPDDQLSARAHSGAICIECHEAYAARAEAHTHHAAGSSGSDCYNCHMPLTSYALFKGIRSHRITSPNAKTSALLQVPNACNLCHLDKSLAWTAKSLKRWYGQPVPELDEDGREQPFSAIGVLQGDAAMRVVNTYAMGWAEAQQASGRDWQAAILAELLVDPYAAVRFVASRSLRSLPGFSDFEYDFIAPAAARAARRLDALKRARMLARKPQSPTIAPSMIRHLIETRDTTRISISE